MAEEIKEQEQQEQEQQEENLTTLVDELKTQYENRIKEIVANKDKEIAQRDDVIKQLLDDTKTAKVQPSIADKINAKRNFRKW